MMKKMTSTIKTFIKEEYKMILFFVLLYIIFQIPVNYYIVTGGGISDVSSRIEVEDAYDSKGSFNISYVKELKGTVITYLFSYIFPHWEREDANTYKYTEEESIEDIEFRSDLDLKTANGNAMYWAYTLANVPIQKENSALYVIIVFPEQKTPLKVGDEILFVDGTRYETVQEYRDYFQTKKEGDLISIHIRRKGKEQVIEAPLYLYEDHLILGVGLQYVHEYTSSKDVKIQFRSSESGPSGGLITTLEIYNQLTKQDLTKGKSIAGTGTIEEDGTIGEIGGIEHKLLGAMDAGADIFLVPSGRNYKDALQYKKEKKMKIQLIEVKNIKDAVQKLEALQ